jgi:hypothetical protein
MEEEKPTPAFSGGFRAFDVREGQGKPSEPPTEDSQSSIIDFPDQHSAATRTDTDEGEWVSGIKLAGIIVALTTAAFLMLLDTSVVTTVSASLCSCYYTHQKGNPTDHKRLSLPAGYWLVW